MFNLYRFKPFNLCSCGNDSLNVWKFADDRSSVSAHTTVQ